jgi:4-hydroxybenzoate polyprenyltransferase
MLAFMQLVFRYGFFKFQNISLALNDWQYVLLVLSTVLLAAGGYVINNIFDQDTDTINKPNNVIIGKSISEAKAYNIYVALNCIGVGIGFYLSNVIQKPGFASIFILIAATLYFYATSLKQMILIGNIIVALLLAFSVIIIGVFDLYPATYEGNQQEMAVIFSILLDYALFTFILNFIREIVKDLEDVNGDYNQGMNTLPIAIGINRTSKIVFALSFIPVLAILFYINNYLFQLQFATLYLMLSVLGPLLYFTFKIWNAKTKNDFYKLSLLLKWILLFGIVSIVVITLNMHYNA